MTIDVEGITDFNSGMFDLTFDHKVVNVDDVTDGSIDDTEIPVAMWAPMDSDTIKVMLELPETNTASGSGYLAGITFKVKGDEGEESALEIADGELVKYVFEDERATPEAIVVNNWNGAVVKIGVKKEKEEEEPTPTLAPKETPKPTARPEKKSTPTPTPGFEAIFAIAMISAIAYILHRRNPFSKEKGFTEKGKRGRKKL